MRDGPNKFILRDGTSTRYIPCHHHVGRGSWVTVTVTYRAARLVDDTHVLVKTANLEQIKDLLQDEVGRALTPERS